MRIQKKDECSQSKIDKCSQLKKLNVYNLKKDEFSQSKKLNVHN